MRFIPARRSAQLAAAPEPTPTFALQLLNETREELDRADRKAQILFAASSVGVSVVVAGIVAGDWSPLQLPVWALVAWGVGAGLVAIGLIVLGISIFPRIVHHDPGGRVAYFGHAANYPNVEALRAALEAAAAQPDNRALDQLWIVSRIVVRKYRLIRWALMALGGGFALGLVASVGGYVPS